MYEGDLFCDGLTVRWKPDSLNRKESAIFDFNGGKWRLNNHGLVGAMADCLALQKVSGECRYPFHATVKVEAARTPDLTQETCFVDDFRTVTVHRIWEKPAEEIVQALPESSKRKPLYLLVTLKVEDDFPQTAAVDSQTECDIIDGCDVSCMTSLSTDFGRFIADTSTTDMTFKCAGQSIRAHKTIVCARSPVICAMLESNKSEGCRVIEIPDVEFHIFIHFLNYIYSAQLPELTVDLAISLYRVGNQYAVQGLAKRCSRHLLECLSAENACDILVVATDHRDEDFVEKIITYMVGITVPHNHWSKFSNEHSELALKVQNCGYNVAEN